jgi:sterol desaturase/sphingolipid hydroxylase (fatty acid hydroxylase superfamily)
VDGFVLWERSNDMTASPWLQGLSSIGLLLVAMALVAVLEVVIPWRARGASSRAHIVPNIALTLITLAASLAMNVALVYALAWGEARGVGLLPALALPASVATVGAVVALDFSFYVAHVAMHKVPLLWRFHQVHHSDPELDVTSTLRQHPGEGLYRYAVLAAFALALGVAPAAFAIYRVASAVNALLEHANLRVPRWLDDALSFVTTWPGVHKIHHGRHVEHTDSNYGNLLSLWDRLFGTFTPARCASDVDFGLEGSDHPDAQTTAGLLSAPLRQRAERPAPAGAADSDGVASAGHAR